MNPLRSRIWQTSGPERTRSLPNRNLDLSHEHFAMEPAGNLRLVRSLEKQGKGFDEVCSRLLDRLSLACNIELRTKRDKAIPFAFDNRGQALLALHDTSLQ